MEFSNYINIKKQLPSNVNLLAVSKGFPTINIRSIYKLGQRDFGESKFQEANQKQVDLKDLDDIKWHFIGNIQSNKIRKIVENFEYIHSVDSIKKIIKIANVSQEIKKIQKIMIQVKLTEDPYKGGILSNELLKRWDEIKSFKSIKVLGLMTINPKGLDNSQNYALFNECRELANLLKIKDCSMGMTNDWKVAIKAGATWVRLGSLIFGQRKMVRN